MNNNKLLSSLVLVLFAVVLTTASVSEGAPLIIATKVQSTNCNATVTLEPTTFGFYGGGLTYYFVTGLGTPPPKPPPLSPSQQANRIIAFTGSGTNPESFPVPGGSYVLYIIPTGLAYPTTAQESLFISSSAPYPVTVGHCPLYQTGVSNLCTSLPLGKVDPHWQLATPYPSAPSGPIIDPLDATTTFDPVYATAASAWLPNSAKSQWVTPSATANHPELGGQYVYRTTFDDSGTISGRYASDNELLGVYLNGVLVPAFPLNGPAAFGTWTNFTINVGPVGVKTLDFVVRNRGVGGIDASPTITGLRAELGTACPVWDLINKFPTAPQFPHDFEMVFPGDQTANIDVTATANDPALNPWSPCPVFIFYNSATDKTTVTFEQCGAPIAGGVQHHFGLVASPGVPGFTEHWNGDIVTGGCCRTPSPWVDVSSTASPVVGQDIDWVVVLLRAIDLDNPLAFEDIWFERQFNRRLPLDVRIGNFSERPFQILNAQYFFSSTMLPIGDLSVDNLPSTNARFQELGVPVGTLVEPGQSLSVISATSIRPTSLNLWTTPDNGTAGISNVNVTGSGFPTGQGAITLATVDVRFALACGDTPVATTGARSVKTLIGSSVRTTVALPASLTTGIYFISISGTTANGTNFSSLNCSQVNVR